jgi:outer membrane murein-binding lipoprotein Lpp
MIEGTVQSVSAKPHKTKPDMFIVGLKINNQWFNLSTRYPDKILKDDLVRFEVVRGTDSLVDFKTVDIVNSRKASNKPVEGAQAGGATLVAGGPSEAALKALAGRVKKYEDIINDLSKRVLALEPKGKSSSTAVEMDDDEMPY